MTQRREFLVQASLLAAGTVAAGALADRLEAQPAPQGQGTTYDMSWGQRVTGKYRMAFDAPEIKDGVQLHQVRSFFHGYATTMGLKDSDLSAVLIIRHAAVPMVLGHELWADGAFAEKEKLRDPVTGEPAKRNPFIEIPQGAQYTNAWPDGALDTLMSRGTIVLACDLALMNVAGQIARRRNIPRQDAAKLIDQHILKGVYRMPSGIFATCHAQGLGCGMMYAG